MVTPAWVRIARKYEGLREIKGALHEPVIVGWLKKLGSWWRDDEQPWCGTFAAAVVSEAGMKPPAAWYRAKAWLSWGKALSGPTVGAVVVFERQGGGHVGFIVGIDDKGNLMVIGGNQGDAVRISPFARSRVLGYRWPEFYPTPALSTLPVLASTGELSRNEA